MSYRHAALLMSSLLVILAPLPAAAQSESEPPPAAQAQASTVAPPRTASGKLDFANARIADLVKDPKAKAIMEKYLPELSDHYDQIGHMSLTEAAQGALDEPLIRKMKAEYDND
jgi:hypothetical protein